MTDKSQNETQAENSHAASQPHDWRAQRESNGVSLDAIEKQTNIPVRKLEALEEGQFDALGPETFALGYIRRYAKIVGLDPLPIMAAYHQARGSDQPSAIPAAKIDAQNYTPASYAENDYREKKRKVPLIAITVGVLALWGIVMVLIPSGDDKQKTPASAYASSLEADNVAAEARDEAASESGDSELIDTEVLAVDVVADAQASSAETGTSESEVELQEESASVVDAPVQQEAPPIEVSNASVLETPAPTAMPVVQSTPVASANTEQDLVAMSFTDDCWVKIEDATGEVIFAQLQTKEDNLQIFGRAPFKVMLGNARVASVSLNGEAVNIDVPAGKNTMRVTLTN